MENLPLSVFSPFRTIFFCLLIAVVAVVPAVDKVPVVAIVPPVEGSPAVESIAAAVGVRYVTWRPLGVTYVFSAAGIHGVPVVAYCSCCTRSLVVLALVELLKISF
jgi:hypothetical protein